MGQPCDGGGDGVVSWQAIFTAPSVESEIDGGQPSLAPDEARRGVAQPDVAERRVMNARAGAPKRRFRISDGALVRRKHLDDFPAAAVVDRPDERADLLPRGRKIVQPEVGGGRPGRSEEHTSELQSLMRISYAVFCLKKKTTK